MIAPHIAAWALNKRKSNTDVAAVVATHVSNINDKPKKAKHKPDEVVLETKGGGGYQPPPQPTAQEQAEARNWEAQQQADRDQAAQDRLDKAAADKKTIDDQAWKSSKDTAYNSALSSGVARLKGLGIEANDPYGAYADFTGRINQANANLQQGADYSTAFNPTIVDEILGTARSGQRNKYKTSFNSALPQYYGEDTFGDTSDDAILASILDTQYGDALTDLNAARDRGQATSSVYDRALRELGTAKSTANTELQNTGRGVREKIIGDIGTRRTGALDSAANWDFGSTYDPTGEANRIKSYGSDRLSGLEGELRGAVGGKEFFDVNSLLGKANARVGNQTTGTSGTNALFDTFANEATRNNENVRANEGTF
jgi:hypothetical protein